MGIEQKKRVRIAAVMIFILGIFAAFCSFNHVYAGENLNPDQVDLFFLEEDYIPYIGEMPEGYISEYQISIGDLTDTPSYRIISGSSVVVSAEGLISPKTTTWYWKNGFGTTAYMEDATEIEIRYSAGTSVVRVTCGDYTQDITVVVQSYSDMYSENRMNSIISEIITDGMTDLEKLTAITKWVGKNTDYSVYYQSAKAMMIYECGDCWASTNTILAMCEKVGVNAKSRRGNQDAGAGTGHRNVIALCEGKYYIAEAGYSGTRPRGASVYEEEGGFAVSGSTIYQYDGFDPVAEFPAEINGKTITTIGNGRATVFPMDNVETMYIPATITTIGDNAIYSATNLKEIIIAPANESFTMVGDVMYSKDRKKLIYTLRTATEVVIDPNTEEIGGEGINNCTLDKLVIPSNVKKLDLGCLYNTKVNELVIEEGLEEIGEAALQSLTAPSLVVPESVSTYGNGPFYRTRIPVITLAKSMKELPEASFYASQVQAVEIPDGVTSIGKQAFGSCSYLTYISIPKSVTVIGEDAFTSSSKLANIYYEGTEEEWNAIECAATIPEKVTVHFNCVRVTGIDAGEEEIQMTDKGQTIELGAKVLPADASNQNVVYTSSDTSIVKVSGNVITAVAEGECEVTAATEDGGFKAVYQVKVEFRKYTVKILHGYFYYGAYSGLSEGQFTAGTYIYINKESNLYSQGLEFVNWAFDEDVTVYSGKITDSYMTLLTPAHDITIEAVCNTIKLTNFTSITSSSSTICPGQKMTLGATVYPSNAYNKKVAWSSGNPEVATVDEDGILTAVAPGTVEITGTTTDGSNLSKTRTFTVREHSFTETVLTEAGCESKGLKECTCRYCGTTVQQEIPELGHQEVTDPAVPATTTSTGLTEGCHCGRCGKVLKAQKVTPVIPTGWVEKNGNTYYYDQNGKKVTGLKKIDGKYFYFSSKGVMQTGWFVNKEKTYYLDPKEGLFVGTKRIDGKIYYFDEKGVMQTGWVTKNGKTYYFDKDGVRVSGKKVIDGKTYYFSIKGVMQTGWFTKNGKTYYFNEDGSMQIGWKKIEGKWYRFNKYGVMLTGWTTSNGYDYYLDETGAMLTNCKRVIDGVEYTFNKSGVCTNKK